MTKINRRSMLGLLGSVPLAAGFTWTDAEAATAAQAAQTARQTAGARAAYKPKFFTAHEYATVQVLVNLIIPKDAHSGANCFDLARDLAGSVKGLPQDLATNPKYMDGFGR